MSAESVVSFAYSHIFSWFWLTSPLGARCTAPERASQLLQATNVQKREPTATIVTILLLLLLLRPTSLARVLEPPRVRL